MSPNLYSECKWNNGSRVQREPPARYHIIDFETLSKKYIRLVMSDDLELRIFSGFGLVDGKGQEAGTPQIWCDSIELYRTYGRAR